MANFLCATLAILIGLSAELEGEAAKFSEVVVIFESLSWKLIGQLEGPDEAGVLGEQCLAVSPS